VPTSQTCVGVCTSEETYFVSRFRRLVDVWIDSDHFEVLMCPCGVFVLAILSSWSVCTGAVCGLVMCLW